VDIDWEELAASADDGLAKDLGDLNRRFEAGRVRSYLLWMEDDGTTHPLITTVYDLDHPLAALGAALNAQRYIENHWEPADVEN
jgi:hypothetical protein